jgi:hypothetical protein
MKRKFTRCACAGLLPLLFALALVAAPASAPAGPYYTAVIADSPLGYWRLNETSGTVAVDSSGNGRDGTYNGGVTLAAAGALAEGNVAAAFDGTNDYVQLPGSWGGLPAMTFEAWVNTNVVTGGLQAIVSADTIAAGHFQLNGGSGFYYSSSAGAFVTSPAEGPTGSWRHVVLVGESGNTRVYENGVLLGTADTTVFANITSSSNMRIGSGYLGGRFFNGRIDEVAIYGTALSGQQVLDHYNAAFVVPEPSTVTLGLIGLAVALATCAGKRTRPRRCAVALAPAAAGCST